jgi:polar amino acid transport system permease protein
MRDASRITDLPVLLPARDPVSPSDAATRWIKPLASTRVLLLLLVAFMASSAFAQVTGQPFRPGVVSLLTRWFPVIFQGFLFNLLVSLLTMALGTVLGVFLGLAQVSALAAVRMLSWAVTQFFRNAPWLVLLFYAMLTFPFQFTLFGATIAVPAWVKAVIGLALPVMANIAEIVRGGVQSIPAGQWESAESLGFSRWQTMWMIILPQAVKRMIPPWMNQYAILTMATTLISIVGIQDGLTMTRAALVAEARTDLLIPMYLMLLVLFFAYCYPIARLTISLERRFAVKI